MKALQYIETVSSLEGASHILETLLEQVDYLGGRILLPSPEKPNYRVQAFFKDVPEADVNTFPDGMRRVVIPECLYSRYGIEPDTQP